MAKVNAKGLIWDGAEVLNPNVSLWYNRVLHFLDDHFSQQKIKC